MTETSAAMTRPAEPGSPRAAGACATPAKRSRAGRNLPAAIASGVVLVAAVVLSLVFWKPAFMLIVAAAVVVAVWEMHQGLQAEDIDLPQEPLMVGGVVMVRGRLPVRRARPRHGHRRHRAGHDAVAAAPRGAGLRPRPPPPRCSP